MHGNDNNRWFLGNSTSNGNAVAAEKNKCTENVKLCRYRIATFYELALPLLLQHCDYCHFYALLVSVSQGIESICG